MEEEEQKRRNQRDNRQVSRAFVMVLQVGISMMTPIFLCGVLGYLLDRRFSASCWFIIGIVVGILTAFRNVFLMMRKFYAKDLKKESEELRYMKELKEYHREHGPENIEDLKVRRKRKRGNEQ